MKIIFNEDNSILMYIFLKNIEFENFTAHNSHTIFNVLIYLWNEFLLFTEAAQWAVYDDLKATLKSGSETCHNMFNPPPKKCFS